MNNFIRKVKWLFSKDAPKIVRILTVCVFAFAKFWLFMRFSPYHDLKTFLSLPESVRYYDRNGNLLQITPVEEGLRRERPREIPQSVKAVFVFAEDRRFYSHPGVDFASLFRALFQNIGSGRRVSGASTITMQLVRIIETSAQNQVPKKQTAFSKIGEIINALRLEARFSKDEILEMYLLSLPFGYNTAGVGTAARTFFASEPETLSPSQVFCLAVIPRRPSLYNPLENPQTCIAAAKELQAKFAQVKKYKKKFPLYAQVNEYDWDFAAGSAQRFVYPFELPHLIRRINPAYAKDKKIRCGTNTGEVRLSIDLALQRYLEDTIAGNVAQYYHNRLTNGSAIVIDNETGEILAYAGSADFFKTTDAGQVDGVIALNQPGSSMKPFLYAMALENGFKPTDVIADIQMIFGEDELYIPRNFNERFNGPILFRAALASSLNIPAVYLLYRLGVMNYSDLLFDMGFDSLRSSAEDAGLGLALGNAPVSLIELARAFSVFPRDGLALELTHEYQSLEALQKKSNKKEKRIFSEDTSRIICSFLSDSGARTIAFGRGRNFITDFPAIFKTGTANQYQSIVALGASKRYTAAVWMGNFTGETVIGKTGSSIPAAIANTALDFLESSHRTHDNFEKPGNWNLQQICSVSGMAPSPACLSVLDEFVHNNDTNSICTWHQIVNGRSETVFPAEYQAWFNAFGREGSIDYSSRPLEIVTPREGFVYLSSPGIGIDEIPVEVIGGAEEVLKVTHNNDSFTVNRPFVFYLPRTGGVNRLYVENGGEAHAVSFTVVE